ncbi:MAG TPA: Maf family protein [Candidatus Hydrothermia bacterium]|nr:septum formation protein Maf [Candidatus Hydrothermae bacterium]MDD3648908.1 Maf family protein [Candidatus Hydrothermia bacterium]HOK23149.1 Maf family protein [Candidatus Hydrothermia bacterium]HOL23853.1 Maf family protein [Candidatus Hydrothermia bacterium]HOP31889.1 Maf family protein [Candidatus Hydrothermia bacterium]
MLILASTSPRRITILKKFGYQFRVEEPHSSETINCIEDCANVAEDKAKSIKNGGTVLACDTIVVLGSKILGKPSSYTEAEAYLKELSGKWHEVYTGYAIINGDYLIKSLVNTKVKFHKITAIEIGFILKFDNPLDKAGAYGVQEFAGLFVEKIEGPYYNVVGIPMEHIYWDLKKIGIYPSSIPTKPSI